MYSDFGRGDHDMRREFGGALTLGLRSIAGAHPGSDRDIAQVLCAERLPDTSERNVKIAVDVVRESFQRRDIDDLRLVIEPVFEPLAHEAIDGTQESGQGFARAGRCGDKHVAASLDRGPSVGLRRSGHGEALVKPRADCGVEKIKRHAKNQLNLRAEAPARSTPSQPLTGKDFLRAFNRARPLPEPFSPRGHARQGKDGPTISLAS